MSIAAESDERPSTPEQNARVRREHTGGDLYLMSLGSNMSAVIARADEAPEKIIVAPDGSVSARFRYLPEKDRWGSPWMIQDPNVGDDEGCGSDDLDVAPHSLTGVQDAVLKSITSSPRSIHGFGKRGDDLIILFPYDEGMLLEREITPTGRSREVLVV